MSEQQSTQLTRKEFIKLLIAGGTAATAASFLPGKWVKPIMKVGVLPVHAQGSGPLTVNNLRLYYTGIGMIGKGAGLASPVIKPSSYDARGTVDYSDPEGGVGMDSEIYLEHEIEGTIINNQTITALGGSINGTSSIGTILFYFYMNGYLNGTFTLKLTSDGRESLGTNATMSKLE